MNVNVVLADLAVPMPELEPASRHLADQPTTV